MDIFKDKRGYRVQIFDLRNSDHSDSFTVRKSFDDSEEVVEYLFEEDDFVVCNLSSGIRKATLKRKGARNWMIKRAVSLGSGDWNEISTAGMPDLMVGQKYTNEMGFVEVKTSGTGLSASQLNWINRHKDIPVRLAYVTPRHKLVGL